MRHVYVYYRIDPIHADLAAQQVDALLQAMRPHCGSAPRLMKRCDDATTWMETYEGIAQLEAFLTALDETVDTLGLNALIPAARHLECFDDTAPGASN